MPSPTRDDRLEAAASDDADLVIGIDVGTGSARAGIFDLQGRLVASASNDIPLYRDKGAIVEQSSEEIWQSVCRSVREAMATSGTDPHRIAGIGVDATCSLVLVTSDGDPLPVQARGERHRNVIVWMDHRAAAQAERINATGHAVLQYVGGRISPEMETPKLLWLKENARESYDAAGHFFDLTDYLTWRATDDPARSVCTVTCKWTYLAHEQRWDPDYFRTVGLDDLIASDFARIGSRVVEAGAPLGTGLAPKAAGELGLRPGTPVGAGLIDAHAGGVGSVGAPGQAGTLTTRLAYIFGTSACSMATTVKPAFVNGVWGPYFSAMVPGYWLNEGGQSAAGAAIDRLVQMHPAASGAQERARAEGVSLVAWLSAQAQARGAGSAEALALAGHVHVLPEFLGNRSPHADPDAHAIIAGLGMETGIDSLIALYVAGLFGLGYGVRQLADALRASGVHIDTLVISGGAGRSEFVRRAIADASGLTIATPDTAEPVLLGSAILGAAAGGCHADIAAGMRAMSRFGPVVTPCTGDAATVHAERHAGFEAMQVLDRTLRRIR